MSMCGTAAWLALKYSTARGVSTADTACPGGVLFAHSMCGVCAGALQYVGAARCGRPSSAACRYLKTYAINLKMYATRLRWCQPLSSPGIAEKYNVVRLPN
jgi:hypothetical protein